MKTGTVIRTIILVILKKSPYPKKENKKYYPEF